MLTRIRAVIMQTLLCISKKGRDEQKTETVFFFLFVTAPILTTLSSRVVSAFLTESGMIYVGHRKCLDTPENLHRGLVIA